MKRNKEIREVSELLTNKEKLVFKKQNGTIIEDVHQYVKDWVINNEYGSVIIGCDSQEYSRYVKYAIGIVMHRKDKYGVGHGGHIINATFIDTSKTMKSDTFSKLWVEAELAIEAAKMVGEVGIKIKIHLDYNSDSSKYSHVLYNAGIGFCEGMGYEALGKPFSYCASIVCDKFAKSSKY